MTRGKVVTSTSETSARFQPAATTPARGSADTRAPETVSVRMVGTTKTDGTVAVRIMTRPVHSASNTETS